MIKFLKIFLFLRFIVLRYKIPIKSVLNFILLKKNDKVSTCRFHFRINKLKFMMKTLKIKIYYPSSHLFFLKIDIFVTLIV